MNYTRQEYANDLIYRHEGDVATRGDVPHPTVVSESGRAVVAHHAVLIIEVLGTREFESKAVPEQLAADAAPW